MNMGEKKIKILIAMKLKCYWKYNIDCLVKAIIHTLYVDKVPVLQVSFLFRLTVFTTVSAKSASEFSGTVFYTVKDKKITGQILYE